jgi:hypothetical protein
VIVAKSIQGFIETVRGLKEKGCVVACFYDGNLCGPGMKVFGTNPESTRYSFVCAALTTVGPVVISSHVQPSEADATRALFDEFEPVQSNGLSVKDGYLEID